MTAMDKSDYNASDAALGIEDYGVIGDCRSAALISKNGAIEWLCWPCFDSPSIFASLVGPGNGGCWRICPKGPFHSRRTYLSGANVLETTFETSTGLVRLTDFMPVATAEFEAAHLSPERELIRMLEGVEGEVEMEVRFDPRPGYAKGTSNIQDRGRLGLRCDAGKGTIGLYSRLEYTLGPTGAVAATKVRAGDLQAFSLTFATEEPSVIAHIEDSREALHRSAEWWKEWSGQCSYSGHYQTAVCRSVLALKLLHFAPSGAFVAAVTTSLPEKIGGDKNYDYRYCWLRDASLTIQVLCGTGYEAEAAAFGEWMLRATRLTQPKLMVMYDVYGKIVKSEKELSQLSGYNNSLPVRIGNMAREQEQMDIYGEVLCASAKLYKNKGRLDREAANALVNFGKYVCDHWMEPDAGIWEPRGQAALHTHSLLLCWVALDELINLFKSGALAKIPQTRFEEARDSIRNYIETNAWDKGMQSYSSDPGAYDLDATLLLMSFHNFHEASSPRLRQTYERVKNALGAGGSLLYRHGREDGNGRPEEGAFGVCGFWAVEYLAMGGGSLEEAEAAFESLLGYANDLGLFAEEIDPESGRALGNFPQAFTHIGLISAALAIEKRRKENSPEVQAGPAERVENHL